MRRNLSNVVRKLAVVAALALTLTVASVSRADEVTYDKAARATVLILGPRSVGSGVVVDAQRRLVATAAHVVSRPFDDGTVDVYFAETDGQNQVITTLSHYLRKGNPNVTRARVVKMDEGKDLAIIQLDRLPNGVRPISLAARDPRPGQVVSVIGHSDQDKGAAFSYCEGKIRNVYRAPNGALKILHATPTNRGDSGGPLVNANGELVGLVSNGTVGMSAEEVRYLALQVAQAVQNGQQPNLTQPRGTPQVRDIAVHVSDVRAMLATIPAANKVAVKGAP
jgi:S1-C subfamily serine protease